MKKMSRFFIGLILLVSAVSCRTDEKDAVNRNALWMWSTHMKEAPLQELADKGYGHILLNEAAFEKYGEEAVYQFARDCKEHGIVPHVWFRCYGRKHQWTYPVHEETMTVNYEFYDEMVDRGVKYVKGGFEGVHLDYIRFAGNAHKYDCPDTGLSSVWLVTECCRRMNLAVKAVNPDAILSAALMPEIDSEKRYGQRPEEMGQWLDVLMPMIYRYGYFGKDMSMEWVKETTEWFVENSGPAEVWAGIQTYTVPSDAGEKEGASKRTWTDDEPIPMDAEHILSDSNDMKNFGAEGIVLFRYGLGEFPDMNDFWK